jgi:hypothetical protein
MLAEPDRRSQRCTARPMPARFRACLVPSLDGVYCCKEKAEPTL